MDLQEFAQVKGFADLHALTEDQRIEVIGSFVTECKKTAAVLIDNDREKCERYVKKLLKQFPGIRILSREIGPVPGTMAIKVAPWDERVN